MYTAVTVFLANGTTGRTLAGENVSTATEANGYILFILHIALSVFILFGSTLTVLAIRRTPELRTQPHLYLFNLAFADGLVGIGSFHCAFRYIHFARATFENSVYLCLVVCVLTYLSACDSLLTLLVMAVDRLVYIAYPYKYPGLFTQNHTKFLLGLSWLSSLMFGALPVYRHALGPGCRSFREQGSKYDRFALPVHILAILLVTGTCYGKIACIAREQRKKIALELCLAEQRRLGPRERRDAGTSRSERSGQLTAEDAEPATRVTTNLTRHSARRSGFPSLGLFVTVNCLFAVCWMPFVVHFFLQEVVEIPHTVTSYVLFLAMSNSAMNTVVLACKNRYFARAYRTLLGQLFGYCCAGDHPRTVHM